MFPSWTESAAGGISECSLELVELVLQHQPFAEPKQVRRCSRAEMADTRYGILSLEDISRSSRAVQRSSLAAPLVYISDEFIQTGDVVRRSGKISWIAYWQSLWRLARYIRKDRKKLRNCSIARSEQKLEQTGPPNASLLTPDCSMPGKALLFVAYCIGKIRRCRFRTCAASRADLLRMLTWRLCRAASAVANGFLRCRLRCLRRGLRQQCMWKRKLLTISKSHYSSELNGNYTNEGSKSWHKCLWRDRHVDHSSCCSKLPNEIVNSMFPRSRIPMYTLIWSELFVARKSDEYLIGIDVMGDTVWQ